jgi:hypothetical protein
VEGLSGIQGPLLVRRAYSDGVAPPKRVAPRRTAAAIGEDLVQVRKVGGIWRADESDLSATLDCLSLTGISSEEDPMARARDLLISYINRGCARHGERHGSDGTAQAAASSLLVLLLRPTTDTRLAQVIRRKAANTARHPISADAVRHRESKIINEIAEDVFADLQNRRIDEPQSVEAAIHRIAPMVADLRQQLHDGLCLTYQLVPPPDPRERKAIEGFYRQAVIKLGDLLLTSVQLADLGLKAANMTVHEFWFVAQARHIIQFIFDEAGDRRYMLDFVRNDLESSTYDESVDRLVATERGKAVYDRWVEWARSCYPTCAFERSTDIGHMCSPHALITLLYDIEIRYLELGYSDLTIPGNIPMMHHRL